VTAFFYIFSVALCLGLGFFTADAWMRDHRSGRWDKTAIAYVAIACVLCGLALGWGIDTYAAFVQLSMQRQ
jgi:predicted transporter